MNAFQQAMAPWGMRVLASWTTYPPQPSTERTVEFTLPSASYGAAIARVWGTAQVPGNLIWFGGAREAIDPVTQKTIHKSSFAYAFCSGPVLRIQKIYADGALIYDFGASPHSRYHVTVYTGSESQTPDPTMVAALGSGNVPAYLGTVYVVVKDWIGDKVPALTAEIVQNSGVMLEDVLADLCAESGVDIGDYDFGCAGFTPVSGFVRRNRESARTTIEPLCRVLSTDIAEIDGQIKAIPMGGDSLATIPEEDLGAVVWSRGAPESQTRVQAQRRQELDLPYQCDVSYLSSDKGFDQGNQTWSRSTKTSIENKLSIATNLVMTDDGARQSAARILYREWAERDAFPLQLPPAYMEFGPGSVVTIPVDGEATRVRFIRVDLALPGPIAVSAVRDEEDNLDQTLPGGAITPSAPTLRTAVPTTFLPESSADDDPLDGLGAGFYLAATGADGWDGATVYYALSDSSDPSDWTALGGISGRGYIGTVSKIWPAWASTFTEADSALARFALPASTLGLTVYVKAVSPYQTLADVTAQSLTIYAPTSPYAPASAGDSALVIEIPLGTPFATGADEMVVRIPRKKGLSVTWQIDRALLRAETAGSSDTTVLLESSPGGGAFTPSTEATLTLASSALEVEETSSLGTLDSDQLIRANVSALGSGVMDLSLILELTEQ